MPELGPEPRLADIQAYVEAMEVERGFRSNTAIEKCLLLGEEVGELFKAVRVAEGMRADAEVGGIDEELADILIYLAAIANRYGVDLEQAFRTKEAKNATRTWDRR